MFTHLPKLIASIALIFAASAANAEAPQKPSVSEEACPLVVVEVPTPEGNKATAVIRTPPGQEKLPAIIFVHGGLGTLKLEILKKDVLFQPTQCRFLAAGYLTVACTFRPRQHDPQTRDALVDCLAVVDYVKKLPRVDPKSVVVFGGSGGGSLALELAGERELCAVAGGEPASVLFTGVLNKDRPNPSEVTESDPRKYYTPELQKFTEAKIESIKCPVLFVHSDVHPINNINNEIVIPAMRAAGKYYEVNFFPGQAHGFYNGYGQSEVGQKVFAALSHFFARHLPTQPRPIDSALIQYTPVVHPGPRVERDPNNPRVIERREAQKKAGKAPEGR